MGVLDTFVADERRHNAHQGLYGQNLVRALASAAGFVPYVGDLDEGIDFILASRGPRGTTKSPRIDVQVKSWRTPKARAGHWVYDLRTKNYNELAGSESDWPAFLFLCVVPPATEGYAVADHDHVRFHRSVYWYSLAGCEPDWDLPPDGSHRILVPHRNLLTLATLTALVHGSLDEAVVE